MRKALKSVSQPASVDGMSLALRETPVLLGAAGASVLLGMLVASDSVPATTVLIGAGAVALALSLPPHTFLAACVVMFGTSQFSTQPPLAIGSVNILAIDLLVPLVVLRALLPKSRRTTRPGLGFSVSLLTAAWLFIAGVAAFRAYTDAEPLDSVARLVLPLVYLPVLYIAFATVMRERAFSISALLRDLALVLLGFVLWMLAMRVLNHPFEVGQTGGLGMVEISSGKVVRRDFGFSSAFILYPILGLGGLAAALDGRSSHWVAGVLAAIGCVATLTTLIRGEIIGLLLGAGIIVVLSLRARGVRSLSSVMGVFAAVLVTLVAMIAAFGPSLGTGVLERSVPLARQSTQAVENARYRQTALDTGLAVARDAPLGLGLVSVDSLISQGVDPGYPGHSTGTWLLVYLGWPGLVTFLFIGVLILNRASTQPVVIPWFNRAFIGIAAVFASYSFTAPGLLEQPWVAGVAALILAMRFGIPVAEPGESAPSFEADRRLSSRHARDV